MTYDQVFASRHLIRSVSLRITMGEINGRQRSFVSADPHGRRTSILLFVGMLRRSKACLMPWYTCYSEEKTKLRLKSAFTRNYLTRECT